MAGNQRLLLCTEHQGKEDTMMPVRFLYYNADSIAAALPVYKKIPLVVNFLFYHGERSPYPYPNTLQAYYDNPAWGAQELSLRFHVIDSTQISDPELLKHGHCAPMELLLKHGRDGNFELPPDAYRAVFQACVAADDDYVLAMLNYAATKYSKAKQMLL